MNVKRLKHLVKVLEKVKQVDGHRRFDMGHWFKAQVKRLPEFRGLDIDERGDCMTKVEEAVCGTSACALGHACLDPRFQKEGLKLVFEPYDSESESESKYSRTGEPTYRRHSGILAGMMFFGITEYEATWLFMPERYILDVDPDITPKMVAKRVRALLAGRPSIGDDRYC